MRSRYRRSFVLPNYTPKQWWECDVMEITASGFFREYEVKLTVGDFLADAKKVRAEDRYLGRLSTTKHSRLVLADPCGPCQFWYVTPEGLLHPSMVPDWAGLIEFRPTPNDFVEASHRRFVVDGPAFDVRDIRENQIKRAPRLHQLKADPKIEAHARSVLYYRLHNLLLGERSIQNPDVEYEPPEMLVTPSEPANQP